VSKLSVAEWRRQVFHSRRLSDPARVYLLLLAEHMRADRKVSVPRATIARALGKSERRITERTAAAHEAGFLSTVSAGYRGHVPVYQGIVPTAERETPTSALLSAETRALSKRRRATHGGPTITTLDLYSRGADRDVGNYDEHPERPAGYDLTVCDCHGFPDCATLHDREESA
jgi:hypothetical protein